MAIDGEADEYVLEFEVKAANGGSGHDALFPASFHAGCERKRLRAPVGEPQLQGGLEAWGDDVSASLDGHQTSTRLPAGNGSATSLSSAGCGDVHARTSLLCSECHCM